MIDGVAACLYLGGLWYVARNIRNLAVLGIALPLGLALVHALYAPVLWAALAALVAWRLFTRSDVPEFDRGLAVTCAIGTLLAWPSLVRPLLDGDSLLYHLPIASSWVNAHSLWTDSAPFSFYPSASEAFASGMLAACGRWTLPLAGIVPMLMLVTRIYLFAREHEATPLVSGAVALAFASMPVASYQVGTLENDLWLTAFVVEVLAGRNDGVTIAITSLIKPFGVAWGVLAGLATKAKWQSLGAGAGVFALWIVRDAILYETSPPRWQIGQGSWAGSLMSDPMHSVPQLLTGVLMHSPQSLVWLGFILIGLCFSQTRRISIAGVLGLLLFAALPTSWTNGTTNWALDGTALRFALPALACGALVAATYAHRFATWTLVYAIALSLWGALDLLRLYSNDGYTLAAPLAALAVVGTVLISPKVRVFAVASVIAAIILVGAWAAGSRAPAFYADWMRAPDGTPTGLFAWLADHQPTSVIVVGIRTGAIIMSSPKTQIYLDDPQRLASNSTQTICDVATRLNTLVVVGSNESADAPSGHDERLEAVTCGKALFQDGAAVVVRP